MDPDKHARTARRSAVSGKRAGIPIQWNGHSHALDLFRLEVMDLIEVVKTGVPAMYVETLCSSMGIAKAKVYETTGLARPTVDRKIRKGALLNKAEGESLIGLAHLVGQVQNIVNESGEAKGFDAAKWTAAWLAQPLAALGGKRPADLMDTADGRELVARLLSQQQSGAYA